MTPQIDEQTVDLNDLMKYLYGPFRRMMSSNVRTRTHDNACEVLVDKISKALKTSIPHMFVGACLFQTEYEVPYGTLMYAILHGITIPGCVQCPDIKNLSTFFLIHLEDPDSDFADAYRRALFKLAEKIIFSSKGFELEYIEEDRGGVKFIGAPEQKRQLDTLRYLYSIMKRSIDPRIFYSYDHLSLPYMEPYGEYIRNDY